MKYGKKVKQIIVLIILGITLMLISHIWKHMLEQKREGYIKSNIYTNKRLGIRVEFPKSWHLNLTKDKKSNVLVTAYKQFIQDYDLSDEKARKAFYPVAFVTSYHIGERKNSFSELADKILVNEFAATNKDCEIIHRKKLKLTSYDAYEVVLEPIEVYGELTRCECFFAKRNKYIICLWFSDKVENFEKNRKFFESIKSNFEITR